MDKANLNPSLRFANINSSCPLFLRGAIILDRRSARIQQRLDRVEQTRQALDFVDEDAPEGAGSKPLFQFSGIACELQGRGLMGEVDRQIRLQGRSQRGFPSLPRSQQQDAVLGSPEPSGDVSSNHEVVLRGILTTPQQAPELEMVWLGTQHSKINAGRN
jgi:hypothetical protein